MTCCIKPDIKLLPWSDCSDLGKPTKVKNLTKYLTMVGTFMFLRVTASGKQVDVHINITTLHLGSGPTQSIITLENGSSKAGLSISWYLLIWFTSHLAHITGSTIVDNILLQPWPEKMRQYLLIQ